MNKNKILRTCANVYSFANKKFIRRFFSLIACIFLFFTQFKSISDELHGEKVEPKRENVVQDGKMHDPIDRIQKFIADDISEEGQAPEKVIFLRKIFLPPPKFTFRPFEDSEKIKSRIYEAIRMRIDPHYKVEKIKWQFWEDEPSYVDIWFDPESALIFGEASSVFQSRAIYESPNKITVVACFADAQKAAKFPLMCEGNLVPPPGGGGKPPHWSAKVAGGIDLDIDTDNNSKDTINSGPDRDLENEDRWESADKDDKGKILPGKYIPINDGDADDDLIPDFADGFALFDDESKKINNGECHFVKAVLDISNLSDIINWDKAKIKFKYSASDPSKTEMKAGKEKDSKEYISADGMIRIWTKDASEERNPKPVSEGGDFIPGDESEFKAYDLFKYKTTIDLYIEGIGKGTTSGLIEVKFSPDGLPPWAPDEVKVTVVGIDADVDSDNDDGYKTPERDGNEDRIEASKKEGDVAYPGKIIQINDSDFDQDEIPDFADFEIKAQKGEKPTFIPFVLEIPEPLDMQKLALKIEYSASDPNKVEKTGNEKDGYTYKPAPGHFRLWRANADKKRNPASVRLTNGVGDWLEPGDYDNALVRKLFGKDASGKLNRKITLWLEAVNVIEEENSSSSGSNSYYSNGETPLPPDFIRISVDPDGFSKKPDENPAGLIHSDTVRATPISFKMIPDCNRDGVIEDIDEKLLIKMKRYYFWINNDNDEDAVSGNDSPDARWPDCKNHLSLKYTVDGVRDFIDFFPVAVKLKDVLEKFGYENYEYVLVHSDKAVNCFFETGLSSGQANYHLVNKEFCEKHAEQELEHIDAKGKKLSEKFLDLIKDGKNLMLVEGYSATTTPLALEMRRKGEKKAICKAELPLSLDSVEKMFRHKNLRVAAGGSGGEPDRLGVPKNYPDSECNNKNFLFIHGYNVTGEEAYASQCEVFKRMFWSGSKAKFYGISWRGDKTRIPGTGQTINYHTNVVNALNTADELAKFINTELKGNAVIAAHSLGNMLASSAISHHKANVETYFIVNGAVAMECYNKNQTKEWDMVHSEWDDYYFDERTNDFLFASEWHKLFAAPDARAELTWSGFFSDMNGAKCYNFFSSGEDVVNNAPHGKAESLWSMTDYAWCGQEKLKGRISGSVAGGSDWCGWEFNKDDYGQWIVFSTTPIWIRMSPDQAKKIPPNQLITKPFFLKYPSELFDPDAGKARQFAASNRFKLLAKAIPARTFGIGGNEIPKNTTIISQDMMEMKSGPDKNWWPEKRPKNDQGIQPWLHSDFKNVAYLYTYTVYINFVTLGGLK